MKKLIVVFMVLLTSCGTKNRFINVSNSLMKNDPLYGSNELIYGSIRAEEFLNKNRKIRNKIFRENHLTFFTTKEPFFILEGYDMETGVMYCTMWNSEGSLNYECNNLNYKIISENFYSESLRNQIEDWKIDTIRKNEIEKGGIFGGLDVQAKAIYFDSSNRLKEIKSFGFSEITNIQNKSL